MLRTLLLAAVFGIAAFASAAGVQAGWRDDMKVLRVGYVASSEPAADRARLEPFRAYLQEKAGLRVELIPAPTYEAMIDAETGGGVDYAIHESATSFVIANASCACLEPLAAPAAYDGSPGYYSVLVVPADSRAETLEETEGLRLALATADSVAGYRVPMAALASSGIDPATHFASVREYPGPEAAIAALLAGNADAAAGWSSLSGEAAYGYSFGVLSQMAADGRLEGHPLRIIWQSPLIPFGPHVVRSDLDPELKAILSDALQAMVTEAPDALAAVDRTGYGGGGFVAVDAAAYAALADLVREPG